MQEWACVFGFLCAEQRKLTFPSIPMEQNMVFADGSPPPSHVIDSWLKLLQKREPIAVHCVAGLGRYGFGGIDRSLAFFCSLFSLPLLSGGSD